ncbi:hypothetical protein C8R43DRAFT_933702 [Mycena crocata]|nr:hypothetical protein C8R43DRAFT_933702 [Mycena crocata]
MKTAYIALGLSALIFSVAAAPRNFGKRVPQAGTAPAASAVDLQNSLTLDSSVICGNFTDDGQNPPVTGQSASSTSTNNYINFCTLTLPGTPLTNGKQITTGSCNPAPIGLIPSENKMPSIKFTNPKNTGQVSADKSFTVTMQVANLHTGIRTNPQTTYYAAPQTLDADGVILGHTHIVIEALQGLDQVTPNNPRNFAFFKSIGDPALGGMLSAEVLNGIPAGDYRICTINSSANGQPVIVPRAQHGTVDDCAYFTAA